VMTRDFLATADRAAHALPGPRFTVVTMDGNPVPNPRKFTADQRL
jgi:hypothetical protein